MPLENKPSPAKPRNMFITSTAQGVIRTRECITMLHGPNECYTVLQAEGITRCYALFVATNERRAEGNEGAVAFLQDNNNASNKVSSNNLRKFIHFAQNFLSFEFLSFNFLVFNF